MLILSGLTNVCNLCSLCCTTVNSQDLGNKQLWGMSNEDDMCEIDDNDEFSQSDVKYKSLMSENIEVIEFRSLLFVIFHMQL